MVTLPAATPVTTPVLELTVAIAVLLEVQTPPLTLLVSAKVEPAHTPFVPPAIRPGDGNGLMVIKAGFEV